MGGFLERLDTWFKGLPLPAGLKSFLSDPKRLLALPAIVAILAVIVLLPSTSGGPSEVATDGRDEEGELGLGSTGTAIEEVTGTTGAPTAPAQATASGPPRTNIRTRTGTLTGSSNPNIGQGVTDKEISVLFAYMPEPCGQDPSAFVNQVSASPNPELSIKVAVE